MTRALLAALLLCGCAMPPGPVHAWCMAGDHWWRCHDLREDGGICPAGETRYDAEGICVWRR